MRALRKREGSFQSTEVDGELVMICVDSGRFFALKDVGLAVWGLLDEESELDRICDRLLDTYDVDAATCRASVLAFADQLVDSGFAEYR